MNKAQSEVGVVMAVYDGVDPNHLADALASLEAQTLPPTDVVLVEDGPLSSLHRQVIGRFERGHLPLRRVALPTRGGSGPARQRGLEEVTADLVAIADADDISMPHRLRTQAEFLVTKELVATGAAMEEFGSASVQGQLRVAPLRHEDILSRLRINNPFNHPTLMFRRESALNAGGYRDVPYLEDYEFIVRLVTRQGNRVANLAEPLVRYRLDVATLRRRRAKGVARAELELQAQLRQAGVVSLPRSAANFMLRSTYRAMPLPLQVRVHRQLLSDAGQQRIR